MRRHRLAHRGPALLAVVLMVASSCSDFPFDPRDVPVNDMGSDGDDVQRDGRTDRGPEDVFAEKTDERDGDLDTCSPRSCAAAECGVVDNGCGGTIDCRTDACRADQVCGENNRCGCRAGEDECGTGACIPLATTAQHCGQCGHDCGPGAMCSGNQCQPAIIVDGQRNPTALTLHEDQVFWVNNAAPPDGAVRGAPKLGVEVTPTVNIGNQSNPAALAVDSTGIYFANRVGNQVRGYTLAGTLMVDNYASAVEDRTPVAVAVDAGSVYWAAQTIGVVRYKSKSNAGMFTELATGELAPAALVVDAEGAYWVNFGAQGMSDGAVRRRLFVEGATTVADMETNPVAIALEGNNLVYATSTMIRRIAKNAGATTPPTTLAMGQGRPVAIAVDTTHVYWVNYDSGELMRVPHDQSQEPEPVVSGLDHPAGIAVDDDYLYISASNDGGAQGAILRVRKPPR